MVHGLGGAVFWISLTVVIGEMRKESPSRGRVSSGQLRMTSHVTLPFINISVLLVPETTIVGRPGHVCL